MFEPIPIIVLVAAIVAVLARRSIGRRDRDRDMIAPPRVLGGRPTTVSTPPASLPPELAAEVREMLAAGKLIGAIKRVRSRTGLGLKEAKDAVEALR